MGATEHEGGARLLKIVHERDSDRLAICIQLFVDQEEFILTIF